LAAHAQAFPAFGLGRKKQLVTGLVGNLLQHTSPPPDFALTNQNGAAFHMAVMKSKVVLLSFIYTHCTDICPFIALKLLGVWDFADGG